MANFIAYSSTNMNFLHYEHLDIADFQSVSDPLVTYSDTDIIYEYGNVDEGESFSFYGEFDVVIDSHTLEVMDVSGYVDTINYQWWYHDYTTDPEEYYSGGYEISGLDGIPDSVFKALTDPNISQAIFFGDDNIRGSDSSDTLLGFEGDDLIKAGFGDDTLDGGLGEDIMLGGDGNDTYVVDNVRDVVIEYAGGGTDTVESSVSFELGGYVDRLILTGSDDIDGTGNSVGNRITGNEGVNILLGNAGNDTLAGQDGADRLEGGAGADYLSGGAGLDTAVYEFATNGVIASLANPSINSGDALGDTYNSVENLTGSSFDDVLNGNNSVNVINGSGGNDTVKGYGGNDRLFGADGNDTLLGGLGADYLSGGTGSDTASYSGATARVTVSLANPAINAGEAAGDTFNSIENLIGSTFNDYVYGNSAANSIHGGSGDDIIKGYAGNDVLTGGVGQDIFVFNAALNASTNVDTITDFNVAADTIQLDDLFFTELSAGTLAAAAFRANTTGAAQDASDRIIYEIDTGELYYNPDGNGPDDGILFAKISTGLALTNADFSVA